MRWHDIEVHGYDGVAAGNARITLDIIAFLGECVAVPQVLLPLLYCYLEVFGIGVFACDIDIDYAVAAVGALQNHGMRSFSAQPFRANHIVLVAADFHLNVGYLFWQSCNDERGYAVAAAR